MARTVPHSVTLEYMQNIVLIGISKWPPLCLIVCNIRIYAKYCADWNFKMATTVPHSVTLEYMQNVVRLLCRKY
jgi:hypothetical protein